MTEPVYDAAKDGCPQVAARCVDCPLSACRYDDPAGYKAWMQRKRRKAIRELRDSGQTIREVSVVLKCAQRSVYRDQASGRDP